MIKNQTLSFSADGTFRILQLTDVHIENGCEKDQKTIALMRNLIEQAKPDFIVITGDFTLSETNLEILEEAAKPLTESGIPWTYVFGNHDAEIGHSKEELLQKAQTLPGCMLIPGPQELSGLGNYIIELKNKEKTTEWAFFFLDSHNVNANQKIGGYDYIKRDQVSWYLEQERLLAEPHSSLAFFHIALPEYNEVWNYHTCYGEKNEAICCPRQNSGLFSAMLEAGNMKGVFVGHDHVNDFHGNLHGIELCFGRATGYNTYCHDDFLHGCRVIELKEGSPDTFDTYVILDNGEVIAHQKEHCPEYELERNF